MEVRLFLTPRPAAGLAYQGLLDFSREFDVGLLDKVVMAFYTGVEPEACAVSTSFYLI